jgi:hypothetical protein
LDAGKITQQQADEQLEWLKCDGRKEIETTRIEPKEPNTDWTRG